MVAAWQCFLPPRESFGEEGDPREDGGAGGGGVMARPVGLAGLGNWRLPVLPFRRRWCSVGACCLSPQALATSCLRSSCVLGSESQ